jgi:nucleotidyltransferase/DNA polymerase involved in DNA repair
MSQRVYGHADADCFYVSAERTRDALLVGKPVAVLGNQGACVIAKSYEMKAAGVKTGEPVWEAVKKCPNGVYIKRDFRWYEVLSRRILDVVRTFSPRVEYYSIDEVFFEVPSSTELAPASFAAALRDRVLAEVGVPITVGIGRSKTLAKLISDTAKPFGARAILNLDEEEQLLARLPVTEVSGIASRRAARLEPYGIRTALELIRADRRFVRLLLTRVGEALWYELRGDPVVPLSVDRPPHQMLSRGGSVGGPTVAADRVYGWLVRNLERLIEELEWHAVCAGALTVSVGHWKGMMRSYRSVLPAPTARFDLLLDTARLGLERTWRQGTAITHMHLIASDLRRPGFVQRGLFDPPEERALATAEAKRTVNACVGRFALRSGATLPLYDVYRDEAQSYDICDIRGKLCF